MAEKVDVLNRKPFVDNLVTVVRQLADSHKGCTFAIDGKWGSGKSFILAMFEKEISLFQDPDAAGDRYVLFRYNCWQYDYYDEPAIAIIAAIRDEVQKQKRLLPTPPAEVQTAFEVAKELGKDFVGNLIETKFGFNPADIVEQFKDMEKGAEERLEKDNAYDTFFAFKTVLDKTKEQLSEMSKDKPIIVIVDELDRCMPEYSIKVLERLHHLFEGQPNIVVILALDGEQLGHAIQATYGIVPESVPAFMKKFISFSLFLDNGHIADTFWTRHSEYLQVFGEIEEDEMVFLNEFTSQIFDGIDIRTQEKIIDRTLTLHKLSFGELNDLSILYFELLYQVMSHRYPQGNASIWITLVNKSHYTTVEDCIGKDLYAYLQKIEKSVVLPHQQIVSMGSPRKEYKVLTGKPLSLSYWYLSALASPIKDNQCNHYHLNSSTEYEHIVAAARAFFQLSQIIK